MKALLVYPETPETFWSFKNALKFISKKAAQTPLGLLTVAAMLPRYWEIKLKDLNVTRLSDNDILWADYVFISGMNIQSESFSQVVKRCNTFNRPVVAGGPMVTFNHDMFLGIDHLFIGEAESTLPCFIQDLQNNCARRIYRATEYPDISASPIPRWDILDMKKYASMDIQYSRGCPFDCEFCSITKLNGRVPRIKSPEQFLAELDTLLSWGWRGDVFIVDDNFIGSRGILKHAFLPALVRWQEEHRYPFRFTTEASINLADDDMLVDLMVQAGFHSTFIGIETPNSDSLLECGKIQNSKRDMLASVKKLMNSGLSVSGGFIVGFDNDPSSIFQDQIHFIKESGIVTAMVGLLNAPRGTRLFKRLKQENRLIKPMTGDNMDGTINFIPKMDYKELIRGYRHILHALYAPKPFFERSKKFIEEYALPVHNRIVIGKSEILAFVRSLFKLGCIENGKRYYWRLLGFCIWRHPKKFSLAVTLMIYGYHFRKIAESM